MVSKTAHASFQRTADTEPGIPIKLGFSVSPGWTCGPGSFFVTVAGGRGLSCALEDVDPHPLHPPDGQ